MLKKIKQRSEGFTIIEVLIVLAIAGLIMVVVFIAVPNLQRNARNNQIETEANGLLTAYSEISNQKGGKKLAASSTATADSDADKVYKAANLTAADSTITLVTVSAAAATGATSASTVDGVSKAQIVTGGKCQTDITSGSVDAGTSRQAAVIFAIESRGGFVKQCQNI